MIVLDLVTRISRLATTEHHNRRHSTEVTWDGAYVEEVLA